MKAKKAKKKVRVVFVSLITGLLTAALMLGILIVLDGRHDEITMLGDRELTLEIGQSYEDPGLEIRSVGRLLPDPYTSQIVYAVNSFEPDRIGGQDLEYVIALGGEEKHYVRHIEVVDTQAPVIELLPIPEGQEPSWMTGYVEPGYTASDNVDGDMTGFVEVTMLSDRIVYAVTDSSGNGTVVERMIPSGMEAPEIELNEGDDLTIYTSMSWEDPGFRVVDAKGTDLSRYVTVEGSVTPWRTGDYELTYTLTNLAGESVTAVRHVLIEPIRQVDTVIPDKKTIYLTFDDGPGPYTDYLLNVLAKYNVKATFFVTGNQSDYAHCIGRAYDEGHTVGVHSYTHNYWDIYASEEAYLADFQRAEELIYEQTGSYTTIFRFPGGSSNTVSRFNPGIMSRLTTMMPELGYYYFDWNVSSGDAGETTDTDEVFWNVVSGCRHDANVVLQHDIKGFSVYAVEKIIIWGLNNGYQFLPLEESSFGAHHGVNN